MKQTTLVFFFGLILSLGFYSQRQIKAVPRVVFCDVGQGDATYLRLPEQSDILIDFGPNTKVTQCLNNNLPYFDRTLEAVFLTHIDYDHSNGLKTVLNEFKIEYFYTTVDLKINPTASWLELKRLLEKQNIPITYLEKGWSLVWQDSLFRVLWPEIGILTREKADTNNHGLVLYVKINNESIFFPADVESPNLEKISRMFTESVNTFKVSHHGSLYGTSGQLLNRLKPELAVISVGKENRYGHPSQIVLDLLKKNEVVVQRTDNEGEIEIRF